MNTYSKSIKAWCVQANASVDAWLTISATDLLHRETPRETLNSTTKCKVYSQAQSFKSFLLSVLLRRTYKVLICLPQKSCVKEVQ